MSPRSHAGLAVRRSAGSPPPPDCTPTNGPGFDYSPLDPFDVPTLQVRRSSQFRVFPHHFIPHIKVGSPTKTLSNLINDPGYNDLYDIAWLPESRFITTMTSASLGVVAAGTSQNIVVANAGGIGGMLRYFSAGSKNFRIYDPNDTAGLPAGSAHETLYVTNWDGSNNLTVLRGHDGSPVRAHAINCKLRPGSMDTGSNSGVINSATTRTWDQVGGEGRDRPLRRGAYLPTDNWDHLDRRSELKDMFTEGYSGTFVEMLAPHTGGSSGQGLWQVDDFDEVELLGYTHPKDAAGNSTNDFDCVPIMDCTGGYFKSLSAANMAAEIAFYANKAASWWVNGKVQVAFFAPEQKTASGSSSIVTVWSDCKNILQSTYGIQATFIFCVVASLTNSLMATYNSVADVFGRWGDRDTKTVVGNSITARDMSNNVFVQTGKPCLGYVAPGDTRPHGAQYWENRLLETLIGTWNAMLYGHDADNPSGGNPFGITGGVDDTMNTQLVDINGNELTGNYTLPSNFSPIMIQVPTWNDWSEGAMMAYSRNKGRSLSAINKFFMMKYMTGSYPKIVRNCIYLAHRTQFANGTMYYVNPNNTVHQVRQNQTLAADLIGALVFATADCDLEFTTPTGATTIAVLAGLTWVTIPLEAAPANGIGARLVVHATGVTIQNHIAQPDGSCLDQDAQVFSPWRVGRVNICDDYDMRVGDNLNGWSDTVPDVIPNQSAIDWTLTSYP